MPPDMATAWAHVRTAAGVISVSLWRSIRQSGSFSHSLRCMKLRLRVFCHECTVAGSARS